jgi:O-antigen ligase
MSNLTKILIFSVIFLIPSYLLRFDIFGFPTNVLEILIYSTFVSFVLEGSRIDWKELYRDYKLYLFSLALIFSGLLLSTFINQNYREGLGIIKGWFFDPLLFSFVLSQKLKNQKDKENIFKTLYFSAFTVSLIALEYFFYGRMTYDARLQAFYSSPNYLAMFLAPSVFIGFYLIRSSLSFPLEKEKIKSYKKNILFFSLFLILFIIFLTYSYAAWISIVFGLLISSLIAKNISKKFLALSFLIIFLAFLTQLGGAKIKNIFSPRSSLESRVMIWKSSALMLKNNFVFGIGPGNFQNKYLEYQKYFPPYLEWAVPHPHNLYLAFWLQSGIFGFLGFVFLIFFWLKKATKNSADIFCAVSLGIVLYILIHGIFDTTYWKNDLSLVFWIIIYGTWSSREFQA